MIVHLLIAAAVIPATCAAGQDGFVSAQGLQLPVGIAVATPEAGVGRAGGEDELRVIREDVCRGQLILYRYIYLGAGAEEQGTRQYAEIFMKTIHCSVV